MELILILQVERGYSPIIRAAGKVPNRTSYGLEDRKETRKEIETIPHYDHMNKASVLLYCFASKKNIHTIGILPLGYNAFFILVDFMDHACQPNDGENGGSCRRHHHKKKHIQHISDYIYTSTGLHLAFDTHTHRDTLDDYLIIRSLPPLFFLFTLPYLSWSTI